MTISQDPDILFRFNEASGTNVPNDGSGSDGTITSVDTPQYTWNQDAGSYDGYLDLEDASYTNQTHITTAETLASTTTSESIATRFQIQGYDPVASFGTLYGPQGFRPGGSIYVVVTDPTTGGGSPNDFNLVCHCKVNSGSGDDTTGQTIFQDLTFGTDYALAISVNRDVDTSCESIFKLDALTEYAPTASDQSGSALDTVAPYLGRVDDWNNYAGVLARMYYWAYWRGYAISSADLALCNSAPKTTIPTWPSAGTNETIIIPTGPLR